MSFRNKFSCIIIFFTISICLSACTKNTSTTLVTSVDILNSSYTGDYSGEISNNTPHGKGTFVFQPEQSQNSFTINGTWKNGKLHGKATIIYNDSTELTAEFSNGLLSGNVTKTLADGSFQTFSTYQGYPYGIIINYDSSNQQTNYDYFYQFDQISDLKKRSTNVDYSDLLSASTELMIIPLKLNCTVAAIYEDTSTAYIKLVDDNGNLYIGKYFDTSQDKYKQAIIPNLGIGDSITAYGYLQQCSILDNIEDIGIPTLVSEYSGEFSLTPGVISDESILIEDGSFSSSGITTESDDSFSKPFDSDLNNTVPIIDLFSIDYNSNFFNAAKEPKSYYNILHYPYNYAGLEFDMKAEIIAQTIDYSSQNISFLLKERSSGGLYYAEYEFTPTQGFPTIGNTIHISGIYNGNYKAQQYRENSDFFDYIIYPNLNIQSLSTD